MEDSTRKLIQIASVYALENDMTDIDFILALKEFGITEQDLTEVCGKDYVKGYSYLFN
jgi:alkylhydroperoxidase/carboxymuconolactone decarboxylase family protein YurZ